MVGPRGSFKCGCLDCKRVNFLDFFNLSFVSQAACQQSNAGDDEDGVAEEKGVSLWQSSCVRVHVSARAGKVKKKKFSSKPFL